MWDYENMKNDIMAVVQTKSLVVKNDGYTIQFLIDKYKSISPLALEEALGNIINYVSSK